MKNIITLIITIAAFASLFAQEPKAKVSCGTEYPISRMGQGILFGNLSNGVMGYSSLSNTILLQKFDAKLSFVKENVVALKDFPDDLSIIDCFVWKGKHYLLFETWVRKEQTERLWIQELDYNTANFAGKPKELFNSGKIDRWKIKGVNMWMNETRYKHNPIFASDSSALYFYCKFPPEAKQEAFGLWAFDPSLNQLWNRKVKLPYTEKQADIKDWYADTDGNIFALLKVFKDDSKKDVANGEPNFKYEIRRYSKTENGTVQTIDFGDKFVTQIKLANDTKGNLYCVGYYALRSSTGKLNSGKQNVDGAFVYKFESSANKFTPFGQGFFELPDNLFADYESKEGGDKREVSKAADNNLQADRLQLRNILFDGNGVYIVGEIYDFVIRQSTLGGQTTESIYHKYKDVFVQRIDESGKQSWARKIPKYQTGNNSNFGLSVRPFKFQNNFYLMFLDNIRNMNLSANQTPAIHSAGWNGILMAVRLNEQGEMKKIKIADTQQLKISIDIMAALELSDGKFLDNANAASVMPGNRQAHTRQKNCVLEFE